jgi:hypothetical protein
MSDDLPNGKRVFELAREAIEFESIPPLEQYKSCAAGQRPPLLRR